MRNNQEYNARLADISDLKKDISSLDAALAKVKTEYAELESKASPAEDVRTWADVLSGEDDLTSR